MDRLRKLFFLDEAILIPTGIQIIVISRMLWWCGWGFGEALIPIFLLQFSHSFAETGLFKSVYDLTLLFSLPIIGVLADTASARVLLIAALPLYMLVGIGYYLAGITYLVFFILFARVANGIAYSIGSVGLGSYVRRTVGAAKAPHVFGFIDSMANVAWLSALIAGMFLVRFLPVHLLLLMITPGALIAMIPLFWLDSARPVASSENTTTRENPYLALIREIRSWNPNLRRIAALSFALASISTLCTFFLPIAAFERGSSLQEVIVMTILFTLPSVASWNIANVLRRISRRYIVLSSFPLMAVLFALVAALPFYHVEILCALLIEIVIVGTNLTLQGYITAECTSDHCGRVSSILEGIAASANVIVPIAAGVVADLAGFSGLFTIVAVLIFMMSWYAYTYRLA